MSVEKLPSVSELLTCLGSLLAGHMFVQMYAAPGRKMLL